MQRSKVLLTVAVIMVLGVAGCVKPDPRFESPLGSYPKVVVDFVDNVTKVYVQGYTENRYSNITIRAFHGNVTYLRISETNTYVMHTSVAQKEFTLNITVVLKKSDKTKVYAFEGNFTVRPVVDPDIILQISIYNPTGAPKVYRIEDASTDLPWSTFAERVE